MSAEQALRPPCPFEAFSVRCRLDEGHDGAHELPTGGAVAYFANDKEANR